MESSLEKCVTEIAQKPSVTGVICSDANGLVLSSRNVESPECCSGGLTAVATAAAALEPHSDTRPLVIIEGDASVVEIHQTDGITLSVFKSTQQ
ncbi:Ragulator complex protein LAMTOR5 [Trinorchestia longiramus]|nr:Ragulator complex protein LAMTOR5 [Trinorchestia longiramus]